MQENASQALGVRKISRSTQIEASLDRVFLALTDVGSMQKWWNVSRGLIEPRKGGVWALAWERSDTGYRSVSSGVIKSFAANKRIRIEPLVFFSPERPVIGPTRLSFGLSEKQGKTKLTVRQDGIGEGADWDWYFDSCSKGWKETLSNLKQHLEQPLALPS